MRRIISVAVMMLVMTASLTLPFAEVTPAMEKSTVSVGIVRYKGVPSVSISESSVNVYDASSGVQINTFTSGNGFRAEASGNSAVLKNGAGETVQGLDGVMLAGSGGTTRAGDSSYRGFMKFLAVDGGITPVNIVGAEQYLYGVVPAEMPASWHEEALKAQAVAARSYMLTQAGVHSQAGYEVCDGVHCQVYRGVNMEHENTTNAVNATAGIVAYYDGKPINAVFSSSSGGITEHSENVWTENVGYLRSVLEIAESEPLIWKRSYTFAQLEAAFAGVGTVTSLSAEFYPTGRVSKITVHGTSGEKTFTKDAVRSFASSLDGSLPSTLFKINGTGADFAASEPQSIADANVSTEPLYVASGDAQLLKNVGEIYVTDGQGAAATKIGLSVINGAGSFKDFSATASASAPSSQNAPKNVPQGTLVISASQGSSTTVTFDGRGYGHGVGMSQYGAKGMAEMGLDYIAILSHYFTGIEVR